MINDLSLLSSWRMGLLILLLQAVLSFAAPTVSPHDLIKSKALLLLTYGFSKKKKKKKKKKSARGRWNYFRFRHLSLLSLWRMGPLILLVQAAVFCRKLCHSPWLKSKALLLLIYSSLRCLHMIETNKSGHRNEDLRMVSLSFYAFDLFPTFYLHRKPNKKKVKKKIKNEKPPTQRKPSMRWKNIRLVVGEDR